MANFFGGFIKRIEKPQDTHPPSVSQDFFSTTPYSNSFAIFLQTVFSYSFRSFVTYHLMRFSLNSTRSESVVPKVYPISQATP